MREIKAFYYCVRCKGELNTAKELWTHKEKAHSSSIYPQFR